MLLPQAADHVIKDLISFNGVLASLSDTDVQRIAVDLTPIDLPLECSLAVAGEPVADMYFMTAGIASTTTSAAKGNGPIEIGITGREGFVSLPVILGTDRSPHDIFMQVPGSALRIRSDRLLEAMARSASLDLALRRFAHVFMLQTSASVLANGRANLDARLARWLLMAHDRVDGDNVPLTHEFLAIMLGVRRAGVTLALSAFEKGALVLRRRGTVGILDRPGIEAVAGGFYGAPEEEYQRLFGRALRRH